MSGAGENALTLAARARRASGLGLADLTVSNPADVGLGWDRARLAELLGSPGCERHEPDPLGRPEAREAVAAYLGERGARVPASRICLSASTSEAYAWWFRLLAEPGDNVLAPEPSYPLVAELAEVARVEVRPYRCVRRGGAWRIDAGSLRPDARTRAVVAISPANPTGHALDRAELALLEAAAARAGDGCALVIDEVFLDHQVGEARSALATLAGSPVPRVALSGLSKVALAPQLKVGWSAIDGPEGWTAPMLGRLERLADTFLSVNTPAQVALPGLLREAPALRARVASRLAANRERLARWCAGAGKGCDVASAEAGWSAVLALPPGVDELGLCLRAVEEGALVHPGHYYELDGAGAWAVLSLIAEEATLAEGLGALGRALARS
jgi:aspartate/methionine/tyrosine aminotransferase